MLRPAALLRFLRSLHARAHTGSPIYFGSSSGGGGHACVPNEEEACHTFRFNTGTDPRLRTIRFRESEAWKQVEVSMLTAEELKLSNLTQVRYCSGLPIRLPSH